MVLLIPTKNSEFNNTRGEQRLYEAFKVLSDDVVIFHSLKWIQNRPNLRFGESDFVLLHRRYGMLCIEVKDGNIRSDGNMGIEQLNHRQNSWHKIRPMNQATDSQWYYKKLFQKKLGNRSKKLRIYSMVWFATFERRELDGDLPLEYSIGGNTFFSEDIDDIEQTISNAFQFYNQQENEIEGKLFEEIKGILMPEFSIIPSISSTIRRNNREFNRMTMQQNLVLDYLEEQEVAAIQGGAGTGKTMLALEKARRLSKSGPTVFLCYNKLLIDFLRRKYQGDMPNVEFTSVLKLAAKTLGTEKISKEDRLYFLTHLDRHRKIWKYKNVIIDEGQDFLEEEILLLKKYVESTNGAFYVFYDKHQMVQNWCDCSWPNELDCKLILSKNLRNTNNIGKTAISLLSKPKIKLQEEPAGEVPIYKNFESSSQLLQWLSERIGEYLEQGIDKNQIVILTLKTESKSVLNGLKEIGQFEIVTEFDDQNILFSTSRKFKGLEADVIFLVDLDEKIVEDEVQRQVFYVAASRARSYLEMASVLSEADAKKMYGKISDNELENNLAMFTRMNVRPI